MGDVLDGILGGEGEVELYEREEAGSDAESPPQDRRRGRVSRGASPDSGDDKREETEDVVMEEREEEERLLPVAERKFRHVVLSEAVVQAVPPFCPVPRQPAALLGDSTFWGFLPHITVNSVLEDARYDFSAPLGADVFDRSQEALRHEEELNQKELERQPPRYLVVFATPADLEQSMQTQKWPIRNPLTEKALNAALLEKGQLVLVFLSREGFQGYATLVSLVEDEDEDEDDSDFLSTWYNITWGTRAVLPTQDAASFIDPLPAEGVMLEQEVGAGLCEALDNLHDRHHHSASDAPRDSRPSDRGMRRRGDNEGRWGKHRSRGPSRTAHLRYSGEVSMAEEARAKGESQRQDRRHDHQRSDDRQRHSGRDFKQHKQDPEFRAPAADDDVRRRMADMARNGRRGEGGQRPRNRRTNRYSEWSDDPQS